ncbi:hypothetical protein FQN57_003474 [Myotisia sp. PD_48]|nr:hypothetical protein FQN57_003474 [Myotisia sp. PD_48]
MADSRLSSLPPRPPTPPRSSSFPSPSKKDDGGQSPKHLSAPSSGSSPQPRIDSQIKRVNFSPMANYIRFPEMSSTDPRSQEPLRPLRPSNQCKPTKSILKSRPFAMEPLQSDELRSSPSEDIPTMLQSLILQLSGDSNPSRRDAYMQLLGSLAAYGDHPNVSGLVENMNVLVECIRRDTCPSNAPSNSPDVSLAHEALNLLNMIIFKPELSAHLPDDFKVYILELAISSIQNDASKTIIIDYMRFLSVQNFSPKVLTNVRVTRLLESLKAGPDRVGGKAVVVLRLSVYDRLFCQARSVFVSHPALWIDNIVVSLVHKVRDIRTKAIQLGFRITDPLGPNQLISKALDEMFDLPLENSDAKFFSKLYRRLMVMAGSRESIHHVPQIWSILTLFLRRPKWSIGQWPYFKDWMMVIQKCFNCSDPATNSQALLAWNRLVYVIQMTDLCRMAKFMFRPIDSQLERKTDPKRTPRTDQAFSSYCNLLYYSFKPATPFERLDVFWKEYLSLPSSKLLKWSTQNTTGYCQIITNLLWNPHPKVWDEKKAIENTKIGPEDLPRLDCKWIRSRASLILPVIESLFQNCLQLQIEVEYSPLGDAWISLSKSLADAANKEVQPSAETMEAIAAIVETLQRLWKNSQSLSVTDNNDSSRTRFIRQFRFLVQTLVAILGPLPFTDKLLMKTSQGSFGIAQTPTHRHPIKNATIKSPILHILHFICQPPLSNCNSSYKGLISAIIESGLVGRSSRGARLDFVRQVAESLLGEDGLDSTSDQEIEVIWQSISDLTRQNLSGSHQVTSPKGKNDLSVRDYDKVTAILAYGAKFEPLLLEWTSLFEAFLTQFREETSQATASAIVEYALTAFFRLDVPISVALATVLTGAVTFPETITTDFQSVNPLINAKERHNTTNGWGMTTSLANETLHTLYTSYPDFKINDALAFFENIVKWLEICPSSFRTTLLERLQTGIAPWLEDKERRLTIEAGADKRILASIRSLKSGVLNTLKSIENCNSDLLCRLDILLTSGFSSHHKSMVNGFISVWNASFGLQETLAYPTSLEPILRGLNSYVGLQLPDFPQPIKSQAIFTLPTYLSSEEDSESSIRTPTRRKRSKGLLSTPSSSATTKDRTTKTPAKSKITTPKPRLRHNNSQIQFVPVEPSSDPTGGELESQVLTEHQKDVRERQQIEVANLFLEVHAPKSTPRQKLLLSERSGKSVRPPVADEEETLSSPTPASRVRNHEPIELDLTSFPSTIECDVTSDVEFISSKPPHRESPSPASPSSISSAAKRQNRSSSRESENENQHKSNDKASAANIPEMSNTAPGESSASISTQGENRDAEAMDINDPSVSNMNFDYNTVIPDSTVDPLEQQIASQLEQDLELSMDLSIQGINTTSQASNSSQGSNEPASKTRKRKRNGRKATQNAPNKKRTILIEIPEITQEIEPSKDSAFDTPNLPSPADDPPIPRLTRTGRKRGRGSQTTELEDPREKPMSEGPATKKRRSPRFRGQSGEKDIAEGFSNAAASTPPSEEGLQTFIGVSMADMPQLKAGFGDGPAAQPEGLEAEKQLQSPIRVATSEPEEPRSSAASILDSLRAILGSIRNVSFGRSTLREIDDVMFDIRVEAHNALKKEE